MLFFFLLFSFTSADTVFRGMRGRSQLLGPKLLQPYAVKSILLYHSGLKLVPPHHRCTTKAVGKEVSYTPPPDLVPRVKHNVALHRTTRVPLSWEDILLILKVFRHVCEIQESS